MILGYHDWWQALLNLVCARGLKIIGSPEIHVLLLQVLVSIDLCPGIHNAGEILVHLQHAAMRGKQHTRYLLPSLCISAILASLITAQTHSRMPIRRGNLKYSA